MAQKTNTQQGADKGGNGSGNAPGQSDEDLQNLLEADADGDNDGGNTDGDGEGGDGEGEGEGNGTPDMAAIVKKALQELLPTITDQTNREIDRRVNSALRESRGKPGGRPNQQQQEDDGKGGNEMPGTPVADIRGARMSFREYLPDSIRFLSPEEKALATEFGLNLISAKALTGFEDEDAVGKEVATKTAEFLKRSRTYYSNRTKAALEKQGAIKKDGAGQTSHGTPPPGNVSAAFDRAEKKMRELGMKVPERKQ